MGAPSVKTRVAPSPSSSSPGAAASRALDAAGPAMAPAGAPSEPLTTMVAPHFLHLILTVLPATFSSAIVYFAWQDWHVIFIEALPGPARRHSSTPGTRIAS